MVARIHARRDCRLARGIARNHPARCGRGVGTLGWYGFWFLDAQEKAGYCEAGTGKLRQAGVKRIVYYDLGEVGDYAAFFTADGKMTHNGWSLPWWKGKEPLTARWFGLEAFMRDVPWAPFPSAKAYGLKPFTTPDGKPADDLYAVLARRGLDGKWSYDYSSNPGITDDIAERSGLAKLSGKQTGPADTQGKSGWQMVRLVDVDYANPQMRDYVCREIEHIIPKLRPDGIHADNLSDTNLGHANTCAFGLWSLHTFRDYLRRHFTPAELERMGIADIATFDIAAYIRDKPFETRGKRWHILNPKWTEDPVWLCYVIHKVETAQAYHRAFYAAAKKSAQREQLDCAVFGNTIPFPLGGTLMKGACDIAHFEWSTVHGYWGMRPMGLPPKGRVGYVTGWRGPLRRAVLLAEHLRQPGQVRRGPREPAQGPRVRLSGQPRAARLRPLVSRRLFARHAAERRLRQPFHPGPRAAFEPPPVSRRRGRRPLRMVGDRLDERLQSGDGQVRGRILRLVRLPRRDAPPMGRSASAGPDRQEPRALSRRRPAVGDDADGRGHQRTPPLRGRRRPPRRHRRDRHALRPGALPRTARRGFSLPGARIVADKPGVSYWRKDRDAAAAQRMAELLDWPGLSRALETDAPATVGVNLNIGADNAVPLLTLDLNNADLDAETDTLRPAPAITTTIRLPD